MKLIKVKFINKVMFISILTFWLISGCKKGSWYDVKSDKALAVPTTLKDMQALMDNGNVMNSFSPSLGEVASDGHYVSDTRALALTGYSRNAYTWSYEQPYSGAPDWTNGDDGPSSYRRIYYSNLVLDGLLRINVNGKSEQEQKNNIQGQALFHRCKTFYELSQVFSPPYELDNSENKFGIPLRLESDINIPSKRSTVRQTYDQIINDLMKSKDLLPEKSLYKTRPSKHAVYGLLARIYLSMENYQEAGIYADLCLKSDKTLINYNSLNLTAASNPFIGYIPEIIFYSYAFQYSPISFSNVLIEENLYNSYHNNDLRKKAFFNQNIATKLITYKGTYTGSGFSNSFTGLATDEIYLIRAECYARMGRVAEAMADLNVLLKTRWFGTYTDLTATDATDALRKILEERKKELVLRCLRWSDLRRLNRDARFAVTLTRTVGNKIYILEPNTHKYTFPIPDNIIQLTGIEQNPGW